MSVRPSVRLRTSLPACSLVRLFLFSLICLFSRVPVCLFVCKFVSLTACLFVGSFDFWLVRWLVCCLIFRSFIRSLLACLCACVFCCPCVLSFIRSSVHSIHSFVCFCCFVLAGFPCGECYGVRSKKRIYGATCGKGRELELLNVAWFCDQNSTQEAAGRRMPAQEVPGASRE